MTKPTDLPEFMKPKEEPKEPFFIPASYEAKSVWMHGGYSAGSWYTPTFTSGKITLTCKNF